ncbi:MULTISPECIES: AraC family transcriptional regulator [Olivibacter]|jgi:AraC-like DNA-binding protein|uniref:AraC family transcriptional regulator n=2 Tax=Olivibacter TaxID=376469 RepID=A0ABV6HSJ6_9SPHI|nr:MULTISPECIES: AraC family transcriptional regulator [Olivibacter]MCL4639276.1 AraC family transcriptional regulator [Olivibacter sp. UJ_SKK_5.1]MDM8174427.1 AraC family transcriptional regulator [Olivibacter sp. 47]MDX3916682.1 AraC family transcriptional regulator [Pseudosphingobacterium sp.]QEL01300.1 AraC family transcriptional regulator [Olivibacter sp. LS-1]
MKPQLLKLMKGPAQSFSVRRDMEPRNTKWHYHSELELLHFCRGEGTSFIGDSIQRFKSGDMVLVGSGLPHYVKFDNAFESKIAVEGIDVRVAHFEKEIWGNGFLDLPENKMLKSIMEKAGRGVTILGKHKDYVAELLEEMLGADGSERIIILMQILVQIAKYCKLEPLSSIGFNGIAYEEFKNDRIKKIYDYSCANFKDKIQLDEIAEVAKISPHSFCRYFKTQTRKTYSQFLTEIRIGHACKLLIEDKLDIKQVCDDSGFNNFTSFFKCFRKVTGKSPLTYKRTFISMQTS